MRFEVPQFIEIEDKIFGPLTWKQFIYLGGGSGMGVVAFFYLPFVLFVFIAIPVGALATALAFYPINNRPFSIFLESIYKYFTSSRLYLWKRKSLYTPQKATSAGTTLPPAGSHQAPGGENKLSSLSRQLELNSLNKE